MSKARYILVGGFLGAGKTTALAALAEHLARAGHRVGVITNDQGSALVDTAILRAQDFDTEEIPGGCFCCRFDLLVAAVKTLKQAADPDVFLAEPVGSCTDLVATVTYPLRHLYGDAYVIAPVSTLVDPLRAEQVLGLVPGDSFSEKVLYIFRKQLEEADLIVLSKADMVDSARLERLRAKLASEFPKSRIMAVSARTGLGMAEWFSAVETGTQGTRPAMEVDYGIYAEGEAMLGWLNATIEFYGAGTADPQAMLASLAGRIQAALAGIEIAHLKIALRPDASGDVAVINLVRRGGAPELSRRIDAPVDTGELTINLRAEASPESLHTAVRQAVVELAKEFTGLKTEFAHLQYFRPGKPVPTHRITSLVSV
jgi:Ni2+-binding GTPase involved in maturation of urease and hydrogenase